jgi:hypothetical protein
MIFLVVVLGLFLIGSVSNSFDQQLFSALTLISTALLFTVVYDFLPEAAGYIRAFFLPAILLLIFIMGIGSNTVCPDQGSACYAPFMNNLGNLLLGRVIFYVSVPLFIGLYIEIVENKIPREEILASAGRVRALIALVLSILLPVLYNSLGDQKVITTFADLVQQLLIFNGGGD